jgi:hypothetical protein
MVKVFGCREAYENRPSTNRGRPARVYGDLVFSLVVVTVAPGISMGRRWLGEGDSSPGEFRIGRSPWRMAGPFVPTVATETQRGMGRDEGIPA